MKHDDDAAGLLPIMRRIHYARLQRTLANLEELVELFHINESPDESLKKLAKYLLIIDVSIVIAEMPCFL